MVLAPYSTHPVTPRTTMHPSGHGLGPSSELISRIHHLQQLLENLPTHLPLNPAESTYYFGLDMDMELVDEEGVWFAFNRNLEVCFETHKLGAGKMIIFQERGTRYDALIQMIKATVKALPNDKERTFLREVWLKRLIKAAKLQEAKVLAKWVVIRCNPRHPRHSPSTGENKWLATRRLLIAMANARRP